MSRLTSGWNMPPGCYRIPDDPSFCNVCCKPDYQCVCPECPVCKCNGDESCYQMPLLTTKGKPVKHKSNARKHGMLLNKEQLVSRYEYYLKRLITKVEEETTALKRLKEEPAPFGPSHVSDWEPMWSPTLKDAPDPFSIILTWE